MNYQVMPNYTIPTWLFNFITELKNLFIHDTDTTIPEYQFPQELEPNMENVKRVEELFAEIKDHPFYKTLINEAPYAKPANIMLVPEALEANRIYPLPSEMDAPFEYVENISVSRIMLTTWVLWMADDSVVVHTPKPTAGKRTCGPETIFIKDPAEPMPKGVTYALKVVVGTTLSDNYLRGIRWTHYHHR